MDMVAWTEASTVLGLVGVSPAGPPVHCTVLLQRHSFTRPCSSPATNTMLLFICGSMTLWRWHPMSTFGAGSCSITCDCVHHVNRDTLCSTEDPQRLLSRTLAHTITQHSTTLLSKDS